MTHVTREAPNDKGFLPFPAGTWREMGFTAPGKRTIAGRRARTHVGFVFARGFAGQQPHSPALSSVLAREVRGQAAAEMSPAFPGSLVTFGFAIPYACSPGLELHLYLWAAGCWAALPQHTQTGLYWGSWVKLDYFAL